MLTAWIDTMTPCLKDIKTGELVDTEVIRIKRASFLRKYSKKNGWYVSWNELLKENEVYALVIHGSVDIQGLLAVRPDESMASAFVTWMCASPENNPELTQEKKYEGVGGHLFAIAAQRSFDYGFKGAISGFAADQKLMEHYCSVFDAEPICMLHPYQIFISEASGAQIKEVYDYEWTDEII